jgi:trimeric autotransporter adhesin
MRPAAALCILALLLLGFAPFPSQPLYSRPFHEALPGDEHWSDQFGLPAIDGFVTCAVLFQGDLVIGGRFSQAGGVVARNIARWDGSAWLPLGSGLDNDVLALNVYEGQLIVGGRFANAGGVPAMGVARWNGSEWQAMGDGLEIPLQVPPAETWAFAAYGGGLVATGAFQRSGEQTRPGIATWDGTQWNALGDGIDGTGRALAVWRDTLYVGGYFHSAGGTSAGSIARWDGAEWSEVGSGVTSTGSAGWVYSLAVYQDELIVGGDFDLAGKLPVNNIASWDGAGWQALWAGSEWGVTALAVHEDVLVASEAVFGEHLGEWNGVIWSPGAPLPIGSASCLLSVDDGLIVGGAFRASLSRDGPIRGFQVAKWTGTDWIGFEPWNDRMHGLSTLFGGSPHIQSLASHQGELIAGGFLEFAGEPPEWATVGPIAAWGGSSWRPLGPEDTFGQTFTLLSQNDTLYAAGTLYGYSNGMSGTGVWRYLAGSWTMLDTLNATIVSMVIYEGDLYVGARRSGTPAPFSGGVYKWDGQDLVSIAWADPGIRAMTVHDGRLVVTGEFDSIGGVDAAGIATWDGHQWEPLTSSPIHGGEINALLSWNGTLVAGGSQGVTMLEGGAWKLVGTLGGSVSCMVVANERLYAGGWLYTFPDVEPVMIVAWDGVSWVGLGSGTNGGVWALQEHDGGLFAGGSFTLAGLVSSFGVGRWNGLHPSEPEPPDSPPAVTRLDPARPNPFRTSTRIPWSIATPGTVRIAVYDTSGRQIAVLENAAKPAGEYLMEWNGLNDSGRPAPSGIYFVSASMPDGVHRTGKIVLVR